MKLLKCPKCNREKDVQNNVIISICPICQVEMKEVKNDIREKETDALGTSKNYSGMITQGDGAVISMGTKELINNIKKNPKLTDDNIKDIKEIS